MIGFEVLATTIVSEPSFGAYAICIGIPVLIFTIGMLINFLLDDFSTMPYIGLSCIILALLISIIVKDNQFAYKPEYEESYVLVTTDEAKVYLYENYEEDRREFVGGNLWRVEKETGK